MMRFNGKNQRTNYYVQEAGVKGIGANRSWWVLDDGIKSGFVADVQLLCWLFFGVFIFFIAMKRHTAEVALRRCDAARASDDLTRRRGGLGQGISRAQMEGRNSDARRFLSRIFFLFPALVHENRNTMTFFYFLPPIRLRHLPPLTGEGWDRGAGLRYVTELTCKTT